MKLRPLFAAAAVLAASAVCASAGAAPVFTAVGADFSSTPYVFTVDGGTFTFSATNDIFNPLAVQTSSTAEVSSFGGFLGIPIEPTSDFVDRGTVIFGPGPYAGFSSPTVVPYSNGQNFIGLEVLDGANTFYGFAYTRDTTLVSYGFETAAGQAITAVTSVPEPSTWAMMLFGVGLAGAMLRYDGRRKAALATAQG